MPVIGFFHLTSLDARREYLAAFHRGLGEVGYTEGRNVAIEYRWAQGQNDRLQALAAELVRRQVSVIVILESTHWALSAKAATQTIPIVLCKVPTRSRSGSRVVFNGRKMVGDTQGDCPLTYACRTHAQPGYRDSPGKNSTHVRSRRRRPLSPSSTRRWRCEVPRTSKLQ
jgi:ABC transporter substrate binding protein